MQNIVQQTNEVMEDTKRRITWGSDMSANSWQSVGD